MNVCFFCRQEIEERILLYVCFVLCFGHCILIIESANLKKEGSIVNITLNSEVLVSCKSFPVSLHGLAHLILFILCFGHSTSVVFVV